MAFKEMLSNLDAAKQTIIGDIVTVFLNEIEEAHASDVHMNNKIHLRINGKLEEYAGATGITPEYFIEKTMPAFSSIVLAENKYASYGYRNKMSGVNYRVTVSTAIHKGGIIKTVQARVLPSAPLPINKLQMDKNTIEQFERVIKGRGIIIVAGDVASGKSTTCSSIIQKMIDERGGKIMTLEDPVEIEFESTPKCQVVQRNLSENFVTFEEGIVPILRENPDVIYVGETRNTESAIGVVQAAMTGALVITTLHASSVTVAKERFCSLLPVFFKEQANENIKLVSFQRMTWEGNNRIIERSVKEC